MYSNAAVSSPPCLSVTAPGSRWAGDLQLHLQQNYHMYSRSYGESQTPSSHTALPLPALFLSYTIRRSETKKKKNGFSPCLNVVLLLATCSGAYILKCGEIEA